MPEAPVDEDRHLEPWPRKVRPAIHRPVFSIPAKPSRPKQLSQSDLRGFVTAGPNRSHYLRANGLGYVVHPGRLTGRVQLQVLVLDLIGGYQAIVLLLEHLHIAITSPAMNCADTGRHVRRGNFSRHQAMSCFV
jgi:hypothetical protein